MSATVDAVPGTPEPRPAVATTTVLYVGGLGRSGSTLLDRLLGEVPGAVSAGEVRDLWSRGLRENRLCGCGTPMQSCPHWTAVAEHAFGGWDHVDLAAVEARAGRLDRHRHVHRLWWPRLASRRFRRDLAEHAEMLSRLYAAIAAVGGGRVVVDSSKAASYASLLHNVPGIDLHLVHLVRDPRGTAYSWHKRVERPDVVERSAHMARYHPARTALRWTTRNALIEGLGRLGVPRVFVRYESLVSTPRAELVRALELVDLESDELDRFVQGDRVALVPSHTVQGNPMRMTSGWIPLRHDEEWRRSLPRRHQVLVTALTRPMRTRYGYRS